MKECPENSRVFIAGLGLGLILLVLAKSKKAFSTLVVEKERRVIKHIEPRLQYWFDKFYPDFRWHVVEEDAYSYIRHADPNIKFGWMFWDIWPQMFSNDASWRAEVKEIDEICKPFLGKEGKVTCWIEVINRRFDDIEEPDKQTI